MRSGLQLGIGLLLLATPLAFGQPGGEKEVDPFMGDWQGTLTIGGKEQSVAVYLIPWGNGAYQAKVVSEFGKRVPTLFLIKGQVKPDGARFVDDLPFDVSRVLGATDKGVEYAASLWTGAVVGGTLTGTIAGQTKGTFKLTRTQRTSPTLGQQPPAGAVVLMDGKSLDAWQDRKSKKTPNWKLLEDGTVQVGSGSAATREEFGDFKLHLEFRTPYMPTARGQGRGNSGVYVHGRYEIQVLDSYGLSGEDNECGGIYKVAKPNVNMAFPPLQWQTYDITFHAPRFDGNKKTENARVTVLHNGVVIHDNLELPKPTPGGVSDKDAPRGPLMLQDHGNPVQYRNVWVQKLD